MNYKSNGIIKTFQTDDRMCIQLQDGGIAFSPEEATVDHQENRKNWVYQGFVLGTGAPACSTSLNIECSILGCRRGALFLLKEASREDRTRSCAAAEQFTIWSKEELTSSSGCGPQDCDN